MSKITPFIDAESNDGLVRMPELQKIVPMSASQIWAMAADGRFPKPIKLSKKVSVWQKSTIWKWIENQSLTP